MRTRSSTQIIAFLSVLLIIAASSQATETRTQWYAGTWDSTLHLDAEHPRTVAIRMELLDKDTHLPVRGINVSLEGEYWEAWISQSIIDATNYPGWDIFVDPEKREPQRREFRLDAISDSQGIVVFALGWLKQYPWDSKVGDKWTYTVGDEWIIYLDDIEKIDRLEIRHPRYRYIEAPLDFKHLIDLKQYLDPERAVADKHALFQQNWQNQIKRKNAKLFVLNLGDGFLDYNNNASQQPEFFDEVRGKNYGLVYREVDNLPNVGDETKCGPYLAYDLGEILLERVAQQIEIAGRDNILTGETVDSEVPWYSRYSGGQSSSGVFSGQGSDAPGVDPGPDITGIGSTTDDFIDQETELLKAELARLSQLSLPTLQEIRDDPAKLNDIVKKTASMKNQLVITGIRALPMVDPDTGQMTTLDEYAEKLAGKMGVGGSLGEDPVATVYMMLFDSNFLVDQARIIRLQDGQYVTLTEAIDVALTDSDSGLDPEVLKRAVRATASLHQAYRGGKTQHMAKALTTLLFAISETNALKTIPAALEDPSAYEDDALYCAELSMSLKTLTPILRRKLGLYIGVKGAIIASIDPNAPPGHADLKPGMVVESWRHELVSDADDLAARARKLVTNPAIIRSGGRDQILLGIWKWNRISWERDYEIIWVVGDKSNKSTEEESRDKARPAPLKNPTRKGKINVIGTDHDGWVSASVSLWRERVWEEAGVHKSEWQPVIISPGGTNNTRSLNKGTATIEVPPGKYKIILRHKVSRWRDAYGDVFEVSDAQTVEKKYYFKKGTINVIGTDHDGWADAYVSLWRERVWEEAGVQKSEWQPVIISPGGTNNTRSLNKGTTTIEVPPGKHKINLRHNEGYWRDVHSDIFEVSDAQTVEKKYYFKKGTINVIGTDHDGWADANVSLWRERVWEEAGVQKSEWQPVIISPGGTNNTRSLNKGTATFEVAPGKYKVSVTHVKENSTLESAVDVDDARDTSVKADFKTSSITISTSEDSDDNKTSNTTKIQIDSKDEGSNILSASSSDSKLKTIDLGNGIAMQLVLIPAGSFYMGSPSTEYKRDVTEGPVRRVQITKPFYISKYEVTQDQYMALTGKNPSHFSGRNLPVETVSWNEAVAFCSELGSGFRLPTEAEWEYACRADSDTRFYYGDDLNYSHLGEYAWCDKNSGGRTHGVGQKKPNSFGLYDMHGNVFEWCSDWWADNYRNAASVDPQGPLSGGSRVLRGGGWCLNTWYCRSAYRRRNVPDARYNRLGFRVVLDLN